VKANLLEPLAVDAVFTRTPRFRLYDDGMLHIEDTFGSDERGRWLISHYPKTRWGQHVIEGELKRRNAEFELTLS
jgi:hypothetical protein